MCYSVLIQGKQLIGLEDLSTYTVSFHHTAFQRQHPPVCLLRTKWKSFEARGTTLLLRITAIDNILQSFPLLLMSTMMMLYFPNSTFPTLVLLIIDYGTDEVATHIILSSTSVSFFAASYCWTDLSCFSSKLVSWSCAFSSTIAAFGTINLRKWVF